MLEWKNFREPLIRNNPTFVVMLGLCPVLAVTTTVKNGLAMGVATTFVLASSNAIVSLIRNFIPKAIRIPCFIVVIAAFTTMVENVMAGFAPPAVNQALGIFVALIVVNCIPLGRAEAFASKNTVGNSFLDGLGMGLGFALSMTLISTIREVAGQGTIWEVPITKHFSADSTILSPASVFILAPGAFIVLGLLMAFFNSLKARKVAGQIAGIDYQRYRRACGLPELGTQAGDAGAGGRGNGGA